MYVRRIVISVHGTRKEGLITMVKWSDSEPWLIENLKKLEVVEEYETDQYE